jgi:O-antigen/teichoic acid export membrane protein
MLSGLFAGILRHDGRQTFSAHVKTLLRGTIGAQAILAITAPLLTRLYSPSEFGSYAVLSSAALVLVTISSLRYEVTIPLATDRREASALAVGSVLVAAVFSVILAPAAWAVADSELFASGISSPLAATYISLAVLSLSVYQVFVYWDIRIERYDRVSASRLIQSGLQAIASVLLGLRLAGAGGLVVGDLVGRTGSMLSLAGSCVRDIDVRAWRLTRRLFGRYRRFASYGASAALLNALSLQVPTLLLSVLSSAALVGQYALSYRFLALPTFLVGQTIGQVYLGRVSRASDLKATASLTSALAVRLFAGGLPTFLYLGIAGSAIFPLIFGDDWVKAGIFAQLMAPWCLMWFVASPLSGILIAREWQGVSLLITIVELILRVTALVAGTALGGPAVGIALLSLAGFLTSTFSLLVFLRAAGCDVPGVAGSSLRPAVISVACFAPSVWLVGASSTVRVGVGVVCWIAAMVMVDRTGTTRTGGGDQ